MALPMQRRQSISNNAAFVNSAMKVKAGIRQVQVSINTSAHKQGNVLLKDLYNERNRLRNDESSTEDLGELQSLLKEMQKHPNATVKIAPSQDNVVHGIFFQDPAMKIHFECFPEI